MSDSAGRFPLPDESVLTETQAWARDRIVSGPRGAIFGPFVPLLRAPRLMDRVQDLGVVLRFEGVLPRPLYEVVVLIVARAFDQAYEWAHHAPIALRSGVSPDVLASIAQDEKPTSPDSAVGLTWELTTSVLGARDVDDVTFAEAHDLLGDEALVELITTAGYYSMLAMILNFSRVPADASSHSLPERDDTPSSFDLPSAQRKGGR